MPHLEFTFCGERLRAFGSGALHWPRRRLLAVADLHLGKSERMARTGGSLLPPYETMETLSRLAADAKKAQPETVLCLGDSFDDALAGALPADAECALREIADGRQWIWISGNHDAETTRTDGIQAASCRFPPLEFRHVASPGADCEISGHYHPKIAISAKGGRVVRPCFLVDGRRVILPAYGLYTGGLHCHLPPLSDLIDPGATAIMTGPNPAELPVPK